ncbi:CLUMA_CG016906, isoform A [Clunio marinus]|uniref:CLUMA_CG016906, isoform A n=1 Tax=Clunio marinus TaxID=568069 RepID=A0A1J1IV92_9DIPT|nr:CLUMA_CG016906, isoform A [Clunio marinus]
MLHKQHKEIAALGHFNINGYSIVCNVKGETPTQVRRNNSRNMHEWSDTKHHENVLYYKQARMGLRERPEY